MKNLRPIAGLTALALLFAACGGGSDGSAESTTTTSTADTATTTAASTTTEQETTTTEAPESTTTSSTEPPVVVRQPLTGAPLASADEIIDRAAMVVKIDNVRSRQNHTGLAVADIVFEEIVEGDATRFAAVFHSQGSDPLGPIRSGRTQDINLFTSYNSPLFVWSGGNQRVTEAINASTLINMSPNNASGYYRGPGSAPHNLYNDTDVIWAQTPPDQPGPPGQQFAYLDDGEEFGGDPTGGVDLRVGNVAVGWAWNPDTGKFDRSQDGTLHIDKTFGQIAASNVVVMGVQYLPSPADRNSPEAQTLGEGPAYIFSDGQVIEGRWQREFNLFPIEFVDLDGNRLDFSVGNTWIELARAVPLPDTGAAGIDLAIKPASS